MAQVEDEYLKTGWLPEAETDGLVEAVAISKDGGWTASQVSLSLFPSSRFCRKKCY